MRYGFSNLGLNADLTPKHNYNPELSTRRPALCRNVYHSILLLDVMFALQKSIKLAI